MSGLEQTSLPWRKSSYSNGIGGECVEVAGLQGRFLVRDSKNPDGPVLSFRKTSVRNLVDRLRKSS